MLNKIHKLFSCLFVCLFGREERKLQIHNQHYLPSPALVEQTWVFEEAVGVVSFPGTVLLCPDDVTLGWGVVGALQLPSLVLVGW